jgi:hypothetical protein
MPFGIAHTVFALSVILIARLVQDVAARSSNALVMRIDVRHMNDDPASRRPTRSRRHEGFRLVCTMEPDPTRARPNLTVNDGAVGHPLEPRGCETKHVDQEIVLCFDIGTRKKRDDVGEFGVP